MQCNKLPFIYTLFMQIIMDDLFFKQKTTVQLNLPITVGNINELYLVRNWL